MKTSISSLGQGPGLAWKRNTSSFPQGSLAELQEWTGGGKTEPVGPSWPDDLVFQQWNTIGWGITDDGVLCIKPWEGDTGETGPFTDEVTPWYDQDQASNIKKVESTGLIMLNEHSQALFFDCSDLTDLTALANWNVSNVTNMSGMFYGCSSLTDLSGLADWNVSNVTDMRGMFQNCSSLTSLTALAGWNVSNVTSMFAMFEDCSSLTDLTALKDWNVSNVTSMESMFQGCYEIQKIGIPSIANGGRNLVENAESSGIADALTWIISEDESMGPLIWKDLEDEMTTNPSAFQEGTVWVKAVR